MKRTPLKAKRGKPRRSSRWQSSEHLDFIRSQPCCNCPAPPPSDPAHVRIGSGAGMGQKPSDWRTVPLCRMCHREQHDIGERTFWACTDVERVIDLHCEASPLARQIRERRNVKSNG